MLFLFFSSSFKRFSSQLARYAWLNKFINSATNLLALILEDDAMSEKESEEIDEEDEDEEEDEEDWEEEEN